MLPYGIIAVVAAYLIGSIPTAYIITRLATGKDIRKLGGGNVGTRNVFHEVGLWAGIVVGIFDIGKGAAAVFLSTWLMKPWLMESPSLRLVDAPQFFVFAAALAVVAGHLWSVFLKFTGGNGLATSLGVLSVLMTTELAIALAITLGLIIMTRNVVLSVNISLLSTPASTWFLGKPWTFVLFSCALLLMLILHFLPTARAAIVKAGSREKFLYELLRRGETREKNRGKTRS
jgi:glycerol-3-phosphate acyltransferase PlsY